MILLAAILVIIAGAFIRVYECESGRIFCVIAVFFAVGVWQNLL
jgi:hypothetical protein